MGVLTIYRELGSNGDVIGKKVAEELNWLLLDNEGFAAAANSYGYVRAEIERGMMLMGCTSIGQLSRDNLRFR